MAVPIYGNDLTTIAVGALATETWDESSDAGWDDAGSMVDDANLYYQGDSCVSAQFTKDGVGTIINSYGSAITVPTDGAILMWHMWAAPPALATKALGGVRVLVGDSFGDFEAWIVAGSDFPPEFIWNSWALNPLIGSPDYTVGAPADYSFFGTAVSALAQARGNPNAMDSIFYGRCEQQYTVGDAATPAVFSGYAAVDNALANKYGLLREFNGAYLHQGLMSFGTAATAVYFDDSNVNINIMNTENVTANFNRYEVNNAASTLKWTAVGITTLGTVSKGQFVVVDNAIVEKASCTFTDMDYFTYQSNSTLVNTTYRRCGLVTQGSGTFTGVTFDAPSGPICLASNNINSITKSTFNSDGTGYAVDLGTVGTVSVNWDNYESGYVAGSTGTDVGVTPTGNETILVNVTVGEILTVNVQTGASTPSIANSGTGTVNVVAGLVTIDWTVSPSITGFEYALYTVTASGSLEGSSEVQHVESTISDNFSYTYTYSAGIILAAQIIDKDGINDFEENTSYYPLSTNDQSFTIGLDPDTNN